VGGFHDMSIESFVCFNENHKINKSPGWNAFDWVIKWFYGGESHPGLKRLIDVHV
jgi:hypothetical protein